MLDWLIAAGVLIILSRLKSIHIIFKGGGGPPEAPEESEPAAEPKQLRGRGSKRSKD